MRRPNSERRSAWPAVVLVVALMPILYVASVGPAGRAVCGGLIRYELWSSAYWPILLAADHSEQCDRYLTSYLSWLDRLPFEWCLICPPDPPASGLPPAQYTGHIGLPDSEP